MSCVPSKIPSISSQGDTALERFPPIVVGKLLPPAGGLVLSFEEAWVWAERERKGRWVVKKGRRQGALAQRMQAASSISLWRVRRLG
jgi:hypothetical protein